MHYFGFWFLEKNRKKISVFYFCSSRFQLSLNSTWFMWVPTKLHFCIMEKVVVFFRFRSESFWFQSFEYEQMFAGILIVLKCFSPFIFTSIFLSTSTSFSITLLIKIVLICNNDNKAKNLQKRYHKKIRTKLMWR